MILPSPQDHRRAAIDAVTERGWRWGGGVEGSVAQCRDSDAMEFIFILFLFILFEGTMPGVMCPGSWPGASVVTM
jgi:hypothetical protein